MDIEYRGRRVRLATGGRPVDGDEPLVVLVHGAGMDRTVWQLQTRWLAHHGRRAAAVDLPGHGASEGPPLSSIGELADWLAGLVETLEPEGASLVGHSMGSLIALETAARHPGVVQRLVLMGVAASMPVHPDLLAAARTGDPLAARLITSWGLAVPSRLGGHPTPGLWMSGGSTALLARAPGGVLGDDLAACDAHGTGAVDAASGVRCPVTLVLGRDDKMTPVRATGPLVEALTGAAAAAGVDPPAVVVVEGAGHMMMLEDPAAVRRVLDEALPAV